MATPENPMWNPNFLAEKEANLWNWEKIGRATENILTLAYQEYAPDKDPEETQKNIKYFRSVVSGDRLAAAEQELFAIKPDESTTFFERADAGRKLFDETKHGAALFIPVAGKPWSLGIATRFLNQYRENEFGEVVPFAESLNDQFRMYVNISEKRPPISMDMVGSNFGDMKVTDKTLPQKRRYKPQNSDRDRAEVFAQKVLQEVPGLTLHYPTAEDIPQSILDNEIIFSFIFSEDKYSDGLGKVNVEVMPAATAAFWGSFASRFEKETDALLEANSKQNKPNSS